MQENWRNFKVRYKDLLKNNNSVATINVKIFQKQNKIFVHEKDLIVTDGSFWYGIIDDFNFIITSKSIRRQENPDTYHLDIKVYLTRSFKAEDLPNISFSGMEYVREAIKTYLASSKTSPTLKK